MANRDHVVGADEQMDLAELDLLLRVVVARGPEDDEKRIAVVLELWPLVGVLHVLERKLVQTERISDVLELLRARLLQPDPGEVA